MVAAGRHCGGLTSPILNPTVDDDSLPAMRTPQEAIFVHLATRQFADTTVAAPTGRIDHRSAADLEAALAPSLAEVVARKGALVLDFAGVDYISSVGLRVLMIAARQMRATEAKLAVAAPQPVVAEILAISRFDKVLLVCATLEAALEQCSAQALAAWRADGPAR